MWRHAERVELSYATVLASVYVPNNFVVNKKNSLLRKAMSVAEVVVSLSGACAKNLVEVSRQLRAGEKLNKTFRSLYSSALLTGKTFGIIGGGTIGQLVAKKL